jgi:hypothetical protein
MMCAVPAGSRRNSGKRQKMADSGVGGDMPSSMDLGSDPAAAAWAAAGLQQQQGVEKARSGGAAPSAAALAAALPADAEHAAGGGGGDLFAGVVNTGSRSAQPGRNVRKYQPPMPKQQYAAPGITWLRNKPNNEYPFKPTLAFPRAVPLAVRHAAGHRWSCPCKTLEEAQAQRDIFMLWLGLHGWAAEGPLALKLEPERAARYGTLSACPLLVFLPDCHLTGTVATKKVAKLLDQLARWLAGWAHPFFLSHIDQWLMLAVLLLERSLVDESY